MRIAAVCALGILACSPSPTPAPHGGVGLMLGADPAELVVHESGEVHLHTSDARAAVTVTIRGSDDHSHSVAMRYVDATQGYVGRLEDTAPRSGEVEVLRVLDGHRDIARAQLTRLLPRAEHDGSIVSVGDHVAEVVVRDDGSACVYLLDSPARRLDVELTLTIEGAEGRMHPLALGWQQSHGCYGGRLEGLRPRAGPLQLILQEEGREHASGGTLREIAIVAPAISTEIPDELPVLRLPEPDELHGDLPAVIMVPERDEP